MACMLIPFYLSNFFTLMLGSQFSLRSPSGLQWEKGFFQLHGHSNLLIPFHYDNFPKFSIFIPGSQLLLPYCTINVEKEILPNPEIDKTMSFQTVCWGKWVQKKIQPLKLLKMPLRGSKGLSVFEQEQTSPNRERRIKSTPVLSYLKLASFYACPHYCVLM